MKREFNTLIKFEDDITYCTVQYDYDRWDGRAAQPCIFHLSIHTATSGDITEYVTHTWMQALEKQAIADIKDREVKIGIYSREASVDNIAQIYVLKMMQAGYSDTKINEELIKLCNEIYGIFRNNIKLRPPLPILLTKEQFDKFKKS